MIPYTLKITPEDVAQALEESKKKLVFLCCPTHVALRRVFNLEAEDMTVTYRYAYFRMHTTIASFSDQLFAEILIHGSKANMHLFKCGEYEIKVDERFV